jgi:hypothetical protein
MALQQALTLTFALPRRGAGVVVALVLALLAGGALAPDRAEAARGMEVALQDDATLLSEYYYDRETALDQAREAGVTRLRVTLLWDEVLGGRHSAQFKAKRKPAVLRYDFAQADSLIDAAARRGIRVHLTLVGARTPAWASPRPRTRNYHPNATRYGQFAGDVARHFRGRVDRYSIWNEPNIFSWLEPYRSAGSVYRALFTTGYAAIKKADPAAKVLIGETSPYARGRNAKKITPPLRFLRSVLCLDGRYKPLRGTRCRPLRADGYAHHPYDAEHSPAYRYPGADNVTMGTLSRLTSALDKAAKAKALRTPRGRPLDVHLTEFGYFKAGPRATTPESRRASYLTRGFEIAQKNPRVRSNLQFLLVQPPDDPGKSYYFYDTSLVNRLTGQPDAAFRALADWSRGAAADGRVARPGGPLSLPPARTP